MVNSVSSRGALIDLEDNMDWTQYIVPVASAITIVAIAIADIIIHRNTSKKFDRIVTEELKLKDAQIKAIEEKYKSVLDSKVEQIKILEYYSSPRLREAYDSMKAMLEERIDQLELELQQANEKMEQQLAEANSAKSMFVSNFRQDNLNHSQREVFYKYVSDSDEIFDNISGTADAYRDFVNKLTEYKNAIGDFKILDIEPTYNEIWIDPEGTIEPPPKGDDKLNDENSENDDPEAPQPVDAE